MNHHVEDHLDSIPSMALDSDEVAERRLAYPERQEKSPRVASSQPLNMAWALWAVVAGLLVVIAGGGFWVNQKITTLQNQLAESTGQLNDTHEKISHLDDQLETTGEKVSAARTKLQSQVNSVDSQLDKLSAQIVEIQKNSQADVDKKLKPLTEVNQKLTGLAAAQDQIQTANKSLQAKLQALDSRVKSIDVDMSALQEQAPGAPVTGASSAASPDLAQIEQRLQAIDTNRQSVNASINKIQSDINALYAKIEEVK